MAFARKRDTVCPGQQLTQLEGPLLGAKRTSAKLCWDSLLAQEEPIVWPITSTE
jgi:hypothetical protein